MNIGRTIRILRHASGLKQKDLACKLGISQNYLSLLENDRRQPSLALLGRLGELLEVPVALLAWQSMSDSATADPEVKRLLDSINDQMVALLVKRMQAL